MVEFSPCNTLVISLDEINHWINCSTLQKRYQEIIRLQNSLKTPRKWQAGRAINWVRRMVYLVLARIKTFNTLYSRCKRVWKFFWRQVTVNLFQYDHTLLINTLNYREPKSCRITFALLWLQIPCPWFQYAGLKHQYLPLALQRRNLIIKFDKRMLVIL